MKHFFRRVNRGIALGVVLLIGLAVFIWQDEATFQKETPAIEHTVTSYLDAMSKINTFEPNLQKIGATMTKEQQTAKQQEIKKIIDQYWTESNVRNGMPKSMLLEQVNQMVTKNSNGKGYIQKFTVRLNGTPTIKKTGPGSASADVRYDVVMEYAGTPMYLLGEYADITSHLSGKEPSSDAKVDETRKRYTVNVQADAELEKIDGTWKLVTMNGGYGGSGEPVNID